MAKTPEEIAAAKAKKAEEIAAAKAAKDGAGEGEDIVFVLSDVERGFDQFGRSVVAKGGDGQPINVKHTFCKEIHGEDYVDIAKEFHETNKKRIISHNLPA